MPRTYTALVQVTDYTDDVDEDEVLPEDMQDILAEAFAYSDQLSARVVGTVVIKEDSEE